MRSFMKRGVAALLALLLMLTSVPMTNVFAAEDDGSETAVEMSVEESAISTSFDLDIPMEESEEVIELPDETGESSEEEETDPARAGPEETEEESEAETAEETEAEEDSATEESIQETEVEEQTEGETTSETESESEIPVESEVETVTEQETESEAETPVFTPDITFPNASYDAFASEHVGLALSRTEQQIQFFNTFVDQAVLSGGTTIDSLFGADNEGYSAEYLLSLNPNQFTETTPVYIGADGNYYVVSAVQALNGTESVDYQPATAFYNGISEAFTDVEYLGSGVYRIPAQRAEYCFSEHYYTDDAAGTIIGVTFGLRIQQLFGFAPAANAERVICADVLYADATEKILPATVNLNSGTVTVKLFPDDSEVDLSSGYNLAAVVNKGESTPSGIQLADGGKTAVFSIGDARAAGCIDIAIAYQAPAATDIPMQAQARALRAAAPTKAALRGAASGSYSMYDSNYAEVDPDQLPSNLAVGDKFYFNARLHVAGVYDNYDAAGNLHIGANSIPTHDAQSFTYYNELADWTVIKNWFATKLSDASSPDPDTVAPGVMCQMTEANMLARAANNGSSVNLSGAKIFGYVSDPLGSNTTNGKTLNLSGISIAIGCMHAWAYMGSTAPADVVQSIYQFTGTNSWAQQQAYGFFEPVVAMQCTEIRKSGNTTYATFKVVTQMLEIGNIQNPANYQCGFATLRLAYEKESTGFVKLVKSSANTEVTSGNACYSLMGAQYTVYSDPDCTDIAKDVNGNSAILTVQDDQGNTNTVELEAGSYWVKETKAGKGYLLDEGEHPVTVEGGKTASVPVKDVPGLDPVNVILMKRDSTTGTAQGAARLEGAEYTAKYYDNQSGTGTPKRTWVFKTNADGLIRYSNSFKVSGDALYTGNSGYVGIPIGTVTIQETKAPEGYILNNETYTIHFTQKADGTVHSDKGVWNTTNQAEDLSIISSESPVMAGIQLKKQDKDNGTSQGDADLSGIEFTIRNANGKTVNIGGKNYENNAVIQTVTSDSNGFAKTAANALPVGKYTIQETKTNASYVLTDGDARTVVISNADNGKLVTVDQSGEDLSFRNTVIKGGVKVLKYDKENGAVPQGDADFSGIRFEVRNASAKSVKVNGNDYAVGSVVLTLTANAAGNAQSAAVLPYGTYTIQEVGTNNSYLMTDGSKYTFMIRNDGEVVTGTVDDNAITFENTIVKGGIKVTKKDADLNASEAQGDGSLKGIKFAIVNDSERTVKVNGRDYGKGYVVEVLTLDETGQAATINNVLPYGSYTVYELRKDSGVTKGTKYADAPKGSSIYANESYLFKANTKTLQVYENGKLFEASFENVPVRGSVKIEKWDKNLQKKMSQGDSDFSGIEFTITNQSAKPVVVNEKTYAVGAVVAKIMTNAAGDAETAQILPYGTYTIQETKTNGSYLLTDGKARTFRIREHSAVPVTTSTDENSLIFTNEVERGGVKVGKIDRETDTNEAQGWATLAGAEFTIYNNSKQAVIAEGKSYNKGSAVKVITIGEDGTAESPADLLPYGTYYVKETKAPEGYLLNTKWRVDFQIRDNGDIVDITNDPKIEQSAEKSGWFSVTGGSAENPAEVPDDIKRADIQFAKYDIDGRKMSGIPFMISRLDRKGKVVESHVVVTDENGKLNTKNLCKTDDKVNSLDAYAVNGVFTDDSKLDPSVGVWFGEQSARDNNRGALIYANYRITELSCKANEGMDLLSEDMFLKEDADDLVNVFENNKVYDLGNHFINLIIHPESDLIDGVTESKTVTLGENITVVDTVRYDHLKTTRLYKIETEIIYVSRDGRQTVSLGTGEKEFYPEKVDTTDTANGTIRCEVEINTAGMNGGTLHAVDTFYVRSESGWVKLLTHNEELDDSRQTLFVPYMETTAADAKTNDHVGTIEKEAEIYDIVTYENLANDRMYKLVGTLRYADTGETVKGTDGNDCVVETALRVSYRAKEVTEKSYGYLGPKDGSVTMPAFRFDASEMAGKTLVVTENLYDYDTEELIISHEELTDEKQSVHYLKVETEARDSKTGTRTATVGEKETIIDKVTLTNTILGMEYIVTGDLVYQADCVDANGIAHKQGDVIAVHEPVTITAKSAKEVVELRYEVDSSTLEGISGVVFEDVWHKEIKVAAHHDYDSKPQTPHWPKVRTSAADGDTKTKTGVVGDMATIVDTVSLTNLNIGDTYNVSGILMQADGTVFTVNGKEVTAESSEFKADQSEMTVEITFTFNSSSLAGKSLVVFEKLFCNGIDVARHEDLTDKDQTVDYPEGHTNASDKKTGDKVGTVGEKETIIDTVTYKNLHIGDAYTIHGDLHYKEDFTDRNGVKHKAGGTVKDENGKAITSSVTFTAEKENGTIDLVYEVNSERLRGTSVVVFEDFEVNGGTVYSHADLEDENQRIDYPDVKTSAADARTEDHVGSVGTVTLIDTVKLTNLTVGKVYKVTGILMDKETDKALLDSEGNEIRSESEAFTATEKDMEIEMSFEANVEELAGKTTVVFEDLLHRDVCVSLHHDITDEEQSVHFPEIGTTAVADETEDHVVKAWEELTITDTVHYRNLFTDGREYTVKGILYDKETGNPILIDGEEVTADLTFIPEDTEGDVEIVFSLDASALQGTTLVAFETVEYKGVEVAVHADINDESQTVYIPEIRTKAYDSETQIDHSKSGKVTLYDQVSFTNLLPEKEYTVKGYLVDKRIGEPILQDGKKVTAEKSFTAEAESGVVIMEFTFDRELISPEPVVVFESLYYKGIEIAVHADIEDEDQSDYMPEIGTTAIAKDTEEHLTNADEEVVIIDTVSYKGLKPNTKYEVTGILMDKVSGEALLDADGKEITSSVTFVTGDAEENEVRADGEVKVTFTFDGSALAGRTTVVFETLYQSGKEVAVHANLNDEAQTIHFPDARTTATDKATETHTAHLDEKAEIEDLVKYENLIPGKIYTVKGTLMVKETGEPLLDEDGEPITAEKEFITEKADGEILLIFTVDTTKLVGKSIVVFEDLQYEGITVVLHADLEDEDQTVVVPEIKTSAADKVSGGKTMTLGEEVILIDTVNFTGLNPGEEYILKGKVMDKASGEVLKMDDKEVVSELRFTPETPDGAVCMEFILNTNSLKGKVLVVFEKLYDLKGNLIAVHEDISDEGQTVKVPTEPPKEPPTVVITGDENRPWPYIVLIGVSAAALMALGMILVHSRKRKE